MIIKFSNNKEFEYLKAIETEEYFNGSNRRTLTFEFNPKLVDISELNSIASDEENVKIITLTNKEITNIYEEYILRLKIEIDQKYDTEKITQTDLDDVLILKLGKLTPVEKALREVLKS